MSQEKTKLRRLLDTVLGSRRAVLGPVLLAAAMAGAFALFGAAEGKGRMLLAALAVGAFGFFGVFLVLGFQTRRTKDAAFAARMGPFLDGFTLLVLLAVGWSALRTVMGFLADVSSFDPTCVLYPLVIGAVAWAHQMRRD